MASMLSDGSYFSGAVPFGIADLREIRSASSCPAELFVVRSLLDSAGLRHG